MAETVEVKNKFELVVLAGERARQLLKGCTPRTQGSEKMARLATLEVKQGHVRKVEKTE
ncbi:MAG TPA: DNA-directed RNA polymerase subunit omega [Vicinamibacterales bacterium]|jgi:DNA-directed RNA polymerase subunit K/omega|nr:DNA-directed RNA polymerase subunit omega [Vicinamibacterales bacterium]